MAGAGRIREKAGRKGARGLGRAALEFMVRDFPGGPVVKTLCIHYREHGFNPQSGN